jgi:hypothetical protein
MPISAAHVALRGACTRLAVLTLAGCAVTVLAGCAGVGQVKPWEKGVLAKPAMSFDGDRLEMMLTEHVYASKEAASGGNGVGGGGCGCN